MQRLEERIVFDGALMLDLLSVVGPETYNDEEETWGFRPYAPIPTAHETIERESLINAARSTEQSFEKNATLNEALAATERTQTSENEYRYYPEGSNIGITWLKVLKTLTSKIAALHKHPPFSPVPVFRFFK
ncbi:MAG: hypothetical protein ACI8RA_001086 [Chlamydiales bacterium]|jgi:hypothetical protein